jgi:hypothetical protein
MQSVELLPPREIDKADKQKSGNHHELENQLKIQRLW